METKKKIIIVEDNDLYRAALKDLINAQENLEVVAETASGGEALMVIKQFQADFIVIEISIAGSGSIFLFKADTGCRHHIVIPVQFLFRKNLVNHATTIATEFFLFPNHRIFTAILPAMYAFRHFTILIGSQK
jgi:AmiR/NasT family two-component response regulator